MIQEVRKEYKIDPTHEAYYKYLDGLYTEITDYMEKTQAYVDKDKFNQFFISVRLPFSVWKAENEKPAEKAEKVSPEPSTQQYQEENYINALCRKYSLEKNGEKLFMKKILTRAQFLELKDKLKTQSYKYVDGQKCFMRVSK